MHELETKLKLKYRSAQAVKQKFIQAGYTVMDMGVQVDTIFADSDSALREPKDGTVVSRLRESGDGKLTLTVKKRRHHDLDRDEYETTVSDAAASKAILAIFGQNELLTVRKRRLSISVDKESSVLIDEVNELGTFLELEVLGSSEEGLDARLEALMDIVAKILKYRPERVEKAYDRLLWEKREADATEGVSDP